jgi:hypothetical protein
MTDDWTHPMKFSRDELEELVVQELKRRNMMAKGPVKFVVGGNPPSLEGAEVAIVVRPVPAEKK